MLKEKLYSGILIIPEKFLTWHCYLLKDFQWYDYYVLFTLHGIAYFAYNATGFVLSNNLTEACHFA